MVPKLFFTLLLLFITCAGFAQEESGFKELTEYLAESLPEEEDLSELTANLSFYRSHPIDLNKATPLQLKELVFLSALQISNFFSHLRLSGKLMDLLELQAIAGFDLETISRLLPYVTLRPASGYEQLSFAAALQRSNHEFLLRYSQFLEKQKGFRDLPGSRYLGSPGKVLFKYKYYLDDLISVSFAGKKDAGESFFSGSNKSGFDFLSGSIAILKAGRFKQIIAGDYSLQFGQGLTLWSGFSLGKGPDVAGVARKDTGLKPYTSVNESSFFRGVANTFKISRIINLTTFISLRSLDASLKKTAEGTYNLSAINTSGLHRTATEISRKGNLDQLLYGAVITLERNSFNAGLMTYHSSYEHEFITGNLRYKRYGFTGKELTNIGLHYNYTFRNIYFFGEAAKSEPGGMAILNGAMASLSPIFSAVLLHRDYQKEHVNFYSQAIGEGSAAANEKGIYAGININPNRRWNISVYSDFSWFPWAKYRIDKASAGYELMGQLSFIPSKIFKVMLTFKTKCNEQNESSGLPVNPVTDVQKQTCRLTFKWKLNQKTDLQNRLEFTQYKKGNTPVSYGYLFYQDLNYHPLSSKISANIRLAVFHIPSYNNRIYAYENDVLHGAGSGLYSGEGVRSFLNMSYRLSRRLRVWSRYAVFYYPGKDKTGSGLDEIQGSTKSEMKLQLRYQF